MNKLNKILKYGVVYVSFVNKIERDEDISDDLYCSAIARSLRRGKKIIIDCRHHACDGGNYFVGGKNVPHKEIIQTYVGKEKIFANQENAKCFLNMCGKCPKKSKYLVFNTKNSSKASIVLAIASPAAVGRILGINSYSGNFEVDIVPSISTCASLFRPLLKPKCVHLNFIDYFDRYHQCKGFFGDDEMIVSMKYDLYRKICDNFERSSHGGAKIEGLEIVKLEGL